MPSAQRNDRLARSSRQHWLLVVFAALWLGGALGAQPPLLELIECVNALSKAGNYSWEEKRIVDFDSRGAVPRTRMPKFATGETSVGGFTVAKVQRRSVVSASGRVAFEIPGGGWRHVDDMTDSDMEAIGYKLPEMPSSPSRDRAMRSFSLALPHEVLDQLLKKASNVRKVGMTYEGDIVVSLSEAMELESYLGGHALPPRPATSRFPGLPSRVSPLEQKDRSKQIWFVVWIDSGAISELSVYFKREMKISLDGEPPEPHLSTTEFNFKLTDLGRTTVTVPPEAAALLSVK